MLIRAMLAAAAVAFVITPADAQTMTNPATAISSAAAAVAQNIDPLPRAKPEDVGMSSERLAEIAKVINADVEKGRLPGAVIAIARKGKLVYYEAIGFRDKAAGVPMTKD